MSEYCSKDLVSVRIALVITRISSQLNGLWEAHANFITAQLVFRSTTTTTTIIIVAY